MKNFLILTNKNKDANFEITEGIRKIILDKGAECAYYDIYGQEYGQEIIIPENTECIFVIGGDGTILKAANTLIGKDIPLLGINLGTLGFLADVKYSEISEVIDALLKDDYQLEHRVMVKAEVYKKGNLVKSYLALNDIVVRGVECARLVRLNVAINNALIDQYNADGIVVCTPTGSTGYNLSAGGPIISPTCQTLVMTPISAHSLTARSIVLAKADELLVTVKQSRSRLLEEAVLVYDGKTGLTLRPGDQVKIKRAKQVTTFIKMKHYSFIEVLKEKMY